MRILAITKDEIIQSVILKKYIPYFHKQNIQLDLTAEGESFSANIINNEYNVIICDLDSDKNRVIEFYQNHMAHADFLFVTDNEFFYFIEYLKENKISNIFPKGLLIEDYITSAKLISNLCNHNIIGIHNYTYFPVFLETIPVHHTNHIRKLFFKIDFLFPYLTKDKSTLIKLAFSEIISNTFFHGHHVQKGSEVYLEDPIIVSFAEDTEKIIFSVLDKKGSLNREAIFLWLFKRYQKDEELPLDHGRGLFLIKNIVDNLIINIKKNELTEFIAIFYKNDYMGEKSLIIHQI